MIRAAGICYQLRDGRVLLCRSVIPERGWEFPAGKVEEDETTEEAARREFMEETGRDVGDRPLILWTRRILDGVDFTTFLARGPEFTPSLSSEHVSAQWVNADFALAASSLLHPGVSIALRRFDMDELGIAKAIVTGELTSPQRYGNMLLISLRVTGTGASYRRKLDEFVWRDSSLYLNQTFLERCNGLPVIMYHPADKLMLDTDEFRKRIVGMIFVPYIKGDEVWGIAKIYDMGAAHELETEEMSTSPGVVFLAADEGTKETLPTGSILLVEDKPSLLDHLAICLRGVWDKGGKPSGVDSISARADGNDAAMDMILRRLKIAEVHRRAVRLS